MEKTFIMQQKTAILPNSTMVLAEREEATDLEQAIKKSCTRRRTGASTWRV